jgi:hypothetical protein
MDWTEAGVLAYTGCAGLEKEDVDAPEMYLSVHYYGSDDQSFRLWLSFGRNQGNLKRGHLPRPES